jgi:hypothetical protein
MNRDEIPDLVRHLREEVVDAMGLTGRINLDENITRYRDAQRIGNLSIWLLRMVGIRHEYGKI